MAHQETAGFRYIFGTAIKTSQRNKILGALASSNHACVQTNRNAHRMVDMAAEEFFDRVEGDDER